MFFKEHPIKTGLASLFILSFVALQLWNSRERGLILCYSNFHEGRILLGFQGKIAS